MWKDRLDIERAAERAMAERREARRLAWAGWHEAWTSYKARGENPSAKLPLPRWWNIRGWIRWLMKLHAPGRPG
jgi:hypothetical protein